MFGNSAARSATAAFAALMLATGTASAATLDAKALMNSFNVIALGDMDGNPHVEGTVFVGGDLTAAGGFYVNSGNLPDAAVGDVTGALVVGGDINGGNFTTAGHGNVVVGGSANVNVNKPLIEGVGTNVPGGVPVADMVSVFQSLTTDLSNLAPGAGSGVDRSDQNNILINQGTPVGGLSVVEGTNDLFSSGGVNQKFGMAFDTTITTIVNIPGAVVTIGANLEGLQFSKVLLNFYEATTLTISAGVTISMLAPFADVMLNGGGTKGTLVGFTIDQSSEIRPFDENPLFDGTYPTTPVPLPAAGWLLMAALGGVAMYRRRAA